MHVELDVPMGAQTATTPCSVADVSTIANQQEGGHSPLSIPICPCWCKYICSQVTWRPTPWHSTSRPSSANTACVKSS
eukprot:6734937-Pyramimonas_sp.AAC.1